MPSTEGRRLRGYVVKPGRLWIRCTVEEWDHFEEIAKAENTTAALWILDVLRKEADQQRKIGHYVAERSYHSSRRLPGIRLKDNEEAGNHNIYCRPKDQAEIQEVANYHGKSFNLWAMEVLRDAASNRQHRTENVGVSDVERSFRNGVISEIKDGHIPVWLKSALNAGKFVIGREL